MVPYFSGPVLALGPWRIPAFSLLLVLAVLVGLFVSLRRASHLSIDHDRMFRMCFWLMVCGFAGAHVAKVMMDSTPQFLADPSLVFRPGGIRSLGGLIGGLIGAAGYCRLHRISFFESVRMMDVIAFSLPIAWMIGRLGCFLAHDHKGYLTANWIGVRFPEGTRYDLGLIEFLFLIGLTCLFLWLDRKPRPVGYFFALFAALYSAFRIWLDTLHYQPYRFYGGAFGCVIGLAAWQTMRRFIREGRSPAPVQARR